MKIIIFNKKTFLLIAIVLILILIVTLSLLKSFRTKDVIFQEPYYKGIKEDKSISIICNIDWGNEYIEDILNVLDEKKVKISFFPTGRWALENKDLLKMIHSRNHEIGNHGHNHLDYDKLSFQDNYDQINKAHNAISEIINEEPKYFGPPSGAYNENTIAAAKDLGYKTVLWSIDTIDWRQDSTSSIILERVKEKFHKAAIILIHPTAETLKALPNILDYIKEEGYVVKMLKDIFDIKDI